MSIFSKLFGKKEELTLNNDVTKNITKVIHDFVEVSITVESSNKEEIHTTKLPLIFNGNEITITEFNKYIDKSLKEDTFSNIIDSFQEFYNLNENKFDFDDSYRLINRIINVLYKNKSSEQITNYINSYLSKYDEFEDISFNIKRADMYRKYDIDYAIEFLNIKNDTTDLTKVNLVDFISSVYYESELVLKQKKYNLAFQILSKAEKPLAYLPLGDYISNTSKIHDLSASICINQKKPDYGSFLFYSITAFLTDILNDISSFPISSGFYYRKSIKYCPFNDDVLFDESLENLKLVNSKLKIIDEITNYAYSSLPLLYGIPEKYLIEENLKEMSKNERDEWNLLFNKFRDKRDLIGDNNIVIDTFGFVNNLFKELKDNN